MAGSAPRLRGAHNPGETNALWRPAARLDFAAGNAHPVYVIQFLREKGAAYDVQVTEQHFHLS